MDQITESSMKIITAVRRWIFVGRVDMTDDRLIRITNTRNIRKWGTTKGLGELAAKGPQEETILDDYGIVYIPIQSVVSLINCDEEKWT